MTWRTTKRKRTVDIDSDLIAFRIHPVYLICKQLVTLLHLELKYQSMKVVMSPIFSSSMFSAGGSYVDAKVVAQLFSTSDALEDGMIQAGSGVVGLSSTGSGFH
ncbi:hypothetical protein Tco_1334408 [Tanacetum coccineum]